MPAADAPPQQFGPCASCLYVAGPADGLAGALECHCGPPSADGYRAAFPQVRPSDWCAERTARGAAQQRHRRAVRPGAGP